MLLSLRQISCLVERNEVTANECTIITLDILQLIAKKTPLLRFSILDSHLMSNTQDGHFLLRPKGSRHPVCLSYTESTSAD